MSNVPENIKRPDTTPNPGRLLPQRDNLKLAVWFFLGGEITLFTALILTYFDFRIRYAADYAHFKTFLNVPLVGLNTFILITSSFLVVQALQAIRRNDRRRLVNYMVGVLALGMIFIGGQAFEWSALFASGVSLSTTFGAPFFIVTGLHGTHVLVGLIWAAFIIVYGLTDTFSDRDAGGVELFGLYWHFVDIVWIVLFTVIYLL